MELIKNRLDISEDTDHNKAAQAPNPGGYYRRV